MLTTNTVRPEYILTHTNQWMPEWSKSDETSLVFLVLLQRPTVEVPKKQKKSEQFQLISASTKNKP